MAVPSPAEAVACPFQATSRACGCPASAARGSHRLSTRRHFCPVRRDVADPPVGADGVAVETGAFELGGQEVRVGDGEQVRVLGLDVVAPSSPRTVGVRLMSWGFRRSSHAG